MNLMRSLKAALAASVCLLPLQAAAQSTGGAAATAAPPGDNWITVGGQYQNTGSYYFGRFTGETHPGFYGLGDFHLDYHDAWDSGRTRYFRADGRDLGLPDRSVTVQRRAAGHLGGHLLVRRHPLLCDRQLSQRLAEERQPGDRRGPGVGE